MILIAGESGQLGQELKRVFQREGIKFDAPGLDEWDVTDREKSHLIVKKYKPLVVINCAAYTAVDKAETEVEMAYRVNRDAAVMLSEAAKAENAFMIQISTDFVFSAMDCKKHVDRVVELFKPEDKTHPQSVYAASKDAGDKAVVERFSGGGRFEGAAVIRTSWLYSKFGNNFVKTIVKLASDESRESLRIIEDQIGRPTWAGRLAEFILEYIRYKKLFEKGEGPVEGDILHFSNSGIASWYDFACAIVDISLETNQIRKKIPVVPINTEEYQSRTPSCVAKRPHFSVMDLKKTRYIMPHIPHWKEDLREYFRDLTGQ